MWHFHSSGNLPVSVSLDYAGLACYHFTLDVFRTLSVLKNLSFSQVFPKERVCMIFWMFIYKYLRYLLEGCSNITILLLSQNVNGLRELSSSPRGQSEANNKLEQVANWQSFSHLNKPLQSCWIVNCLCSVDLYKQSIFLICFSFP